ncbi:hypothetical protein HER10_EVM0003833 [Colletotrichum scovillei]|uniref:Uncharacterized protein n=1 Tax=Colletotrichum scovillei TaxID=1209932 RepID=A0A9P7RFI1_9PEZI|nr:uncharacterized protein HER10_EVM0003833 [Colletotrichum scovillei]KAF4785216.1 hypothetical protein HER10_EVM0003833 [Colletotrichum scovillei]KAG7055482.1 hypothetical protein JMJ77_0007938 [Colletotrichum scovillei]KAG7074927.1 hypothetical protein JMJ76_0011392 [Colletotrichum scovillei]KAG7082059.1 hypothetical protein JMJ78_0004164 [Colletotrichum scovillei]
MASRGTDENEGPGDVRRTHSHATDPMAQDPFDGSDSESELGELPSDEEEEDLFGFGSPSDELDELPNDTEEDLFGHPESADDEGDLIESPEDTEEDLSDYHEDDAEVQPIREYQEPLPARLAREHDRYLASKKIVQSTDDKPIMKSVQGLDGACDMELSDSSHDPAVTPTKPAHHAVETPRTVKALRISDGAHDGKGTAAKKSGPGIVKVLDFNPSPKHYLGLGKKMQSDASSEADSAMAIDKHEVERGPSTPPPGIRYDEEGHGHPPSSRPRSVKTALPVMFADTDVEDNSPSTRRQKNRVRIASASGPASLERPSIQPAGPRPLGLEPAYYEPINAGAPATPTKAHRKRSRDHLEKTLTLAGKDTANMKEIMANYALANGDKADDAVNEDDEGDELTPKASILNSHMDIDED